VPAGVAVDADVERAARAALAAQGRAQQGVGVEGCSGKGSARMT
jgi:hypothetical protein